MDAYSNDHYPSLHVQNLRVQNGLNNFQNGRKVHTHYFPFDCIRKYFLCDTVFHIVSDLSHAFT